MTATRRGVVSGLAASAVGAPAVAQTPTLPDADVVVIGAGAAGLAAADALWIAGRRVVVLEARERIGGRAHTDGTLGPGLAFDAGAQFIHWAEKNPWRAIAGRLGAAIAPDRWTGPPLLYLGGVAATDAERQRRRAAFGRVWSVLSLRGGPDRSFAEAAREAGDDISGAAAAITRLSLGEDPEKVSLADYEQLWAGDDDVPAEGYGALVSRAYADLPVRLGTPALGLRWDGAGIVVETPRGDVSASAAVVTVPVGVLRAGALRFAPRLPDATLSALEALSMGAYTKVALRLDPVATWIGGQDYFSVDAAREGHPEAMTSLELLPQGRPMAIALTGGDHARALCEAGEAAAVADVTDRLAAILGDRVRGAVLGGRLAGWWSDPWSRGSYSILAPGRSGAREALRTPVGERIWFAGEASAGGGAMTVGGATLEGERAAAELLKVLPR